jgi:hypothetical protein
LNFFRGFLSDAHHFQTPKFAPISFFCFLPSQKQPKTETFPVENGAVTQGSIAVIVVLQVA